MSIQRKTLIIGILCLFLFSCASAEKQDKGSFEETVVAGSPDHFMEVRHVVLRGSNFDIGRMMAKIAQRDNIRFVPSGDPLVNKVQREYLSKNYSIFYERMKGVAEALGLDVEDDTYNFSGMPQYNLVPSVSCSVVFYPGEFTEEGHGILSRNFDFTTGTIQGRHPKKGEMRAVSRPYIFEMYPERGYASLAICAFDLMGGVLDGVNSEGLAVAILAEEESIRKHGLEPGSGVGMRELFSMRYLLDNCKDVDEAKEAMLYLKHYYGFIPCHYIIADRSGRSFIFEFSGTRNRTYITEGDGPQCITNHLVANYRSIEEMPEEEDEMSSYSRFRTLHAAIKENKKFTLDEMKFINQSVAVPPYGSYHADYAPPRTLWHALYDTEKRSLSVKFYLGEKPDPESEGKFIFDYSDYLEFKLAKTEKD
jgi:predicted choloylglycine hydrolase